jgi:tRNA-dependent cyclodipeptide synthase
VKALHQIASDYRVTVNGKYGSRPSDKARVQISIGNPKYEGAKMLTLTQWCASRFKETEIIVSDTLQRHNITNSDVSNAWNIAREEGDKWLRRNALALEGFTITRWDSFLHHHDYSISLDAIEEVLKDDKANKSFMDMAQEFATRRKVPMENCMAFLKEELAIFYFMMQEPAVDIYAGSWISNIFETLSLPVFQNLHCLEVDFERKKRTFLKQ